MAVESKKLVDGRVDTKLKNVIVKHSITPKSSASFCLWKNFTQKINLIREVRKCRKKEK